MMTTLPETTERRHGLPLPDRAAVRFLLAHRLGRLMTQDRITAEPQVTPVHYVFDRDGSMLTLLPADSPHVAALRQSGDTSLLSVRGEQFPAPAVMIDADDSGGGAVWHVQAKVMTELLEDTAAVRDILRRQINSVIADLPQHDKSDPTERAGASALSRLIGVRMKLLSLRARTRRQRGAAA